MDNITIKVENDQLLVSSLEVAKNFGKEHKHIREAIKKSHGRKFDRQIFIL